MKPRKIRRNRHSFRRRRVRLPLRPIGAICLLALFVVLGIYTAKGIHKWKSSRPSTTEESTVSIADNSSPTNTPQKTTTTTQKQEQKQEISQVKAFVMSTATFLNKSAREKQIDEASKAGFTGVLFEIKDADGILYYSTSSATAKKNEAIASTAISKEDFKDFLNYCEKQSITCIPRMNCFKDKTAAYKMASARVLLQGEPKYVWLDNTAANGGKPWLNPYSPDAQSYLQDFIKELHDLGCKAICLDTVQFPEVTYLASYGNTKFSSLSMLDVLSKFVTDSQKLAGDCQLIVSAAGLSTFSDSTAIYGGNPLNFGAKIIAPELYPSYFGKKLKTGNDVLYSPGSQSDVAVERSLSQITLRVKLMDKKKQPAVLPFIQGFFYSNTQIAAEIKAATKKNPSAGFILYTYDGIYDFDQYGLKKN